jgi:hypothetical protein
MKLTVITLSWYASSRVNSWSTKGTLRKNGTKPSNTSKSNSHSTHSLFISIWDCIRTTGGPMPRCRSKCTSVHRKKALPWISMLRGGSTAQTRRSESRPSEPWTQNSASGFYTGTTPSKDQIPYMKTISESLLNTSVDSRVGSYQKLHSTAKHEAFSRDMKSEESLSRGSTQLRRDCYMAKLRF